MMDNLWYYRPYPVTLLKFLGKIRILKFTFVCRWMYIAVNPSSSAGSQPIQIHCTSNPPISTCRPCLSTHNPPHLSSSIYPAQVPMITFKALWLWKPSFHHLHNHFSIFPFTSSTFLSFLPNSLRISTIDSPFSLSQVFSQDVVWFPSQYSSPKHILVCFLPFKLTHFLFFQNQHKPPPQLSLPHTKFHGGSTPELCEAISN